MVSMKEVAEFAGVSVATVSRTLSGKKNVKQATKEKIFEAIDKLQYKPNMLGRNLRKSSTNMILALVPSISNPFYSKLVQGIESVLSKESYYLLLRNTYSEAKNYESYIDLLYLRMADGLIWMDPTVSVSQIEKISLEFPTVCCSEIHSNKISSVSIDNKAAIKEVYKHLYDQGYRKIALFGTNLTYDYMKYRCDRYREIITEFKSDYMNIVNTEFDREKTEHVFSDIYHSDQRPDAVIAISDVIAQYILEVANKKNIKVGEEFGLVGFDNIGFSAVTNPSLTTVDQPKYAIGECAAKKILKIMELKKENSEDPNERIVLQHQLIKRQSSNKSV